MVTQHGGPPLDTSNVGDDANVIHHRRVQPHLRLDSINSNNGSGSNYHRHQSPISTLPPISPSNQSKYIPYSPRLPRPNLSRPSYTSVDTNITTTTTTTTATSPDRISSRNDGPYFSSPISNSMPSHHDIPPARSSPTKILDSPSSQDEKEQEIAWPLPMTDTVQTTHAVRQMRSSRTGLRISMSTSSLNGRRRSPLPDRQFPDMGPNNRPLPRFPPRVTPDLLQYNDPLRSSQTSGQTSYSSFEQMSGTERSSILTKSSSFTDISPDTPNGYFGEDDDMTVEDAIGMYLDDIIDIPEDSASAQAATLVGELDNIAENISLSAKHSSVASFNTRPGDLVMEPEEPEELQESQELHYGQRKTDSTLTDNDSTEEPAVNEEQGSREGPNGLDEEDQKAKSTRMTGSSQTKEESAEPQNDETPSAQTISKQAPVHLTIDVSATQVGMDEGANQPIPSPRHSTVIRVTGKVPPSFLPGTDDRDRYGFRKVTHHISREQFEAWNKPYAAFAENRRLKWVKLMQSSGLPTESPTTFPPKSNILKRYVRKGIPSEYRGAAWFYYAGGYQHMHKNPGHYANLVRQAMSTPINVDKEHIERDLYRTFPDNVHFKPEMAANMAGGDALKHQSVIIETQMIRSLRRVLYAFALHNPRIGYTQSLNFIAGMLLLFLPEEMTFWMLHIITTELFPATHEISLEGANVDMWILMVLLRDNSPNVYTKLVTTSSVAPKGKAPALTVNMRLPDITLGLTNWLMSMFIGSLPLETTLRVWDCFFYEGSKTFFRVALGIFKAGEREILSVSDPMEVFQRVQTIPKSLLDANALLEESLSRKYRMGQGRIDELREQRREAVRQEQTRLSLFTSKGLQPNRPATRTGARSPLPRLDGWRALKKNTFNS